MFTPSLQTHYTPTGIMADRRAPETFAEAYADQYQRDHEALGREVVTGGLSNLPPETPRPGARIAHRGERADLHAST